MIAALSAVDDVKRGHKKPFGDGLKRVPQLSFIIAEKQIALGDFGICWAPLGGLPGRFCSVR